MELGENILIGVVGLYEWCIVNVNCWNWNLCLIILK